MAAKVVMVAVPTAMGIASIRVYTVSDVPADGLVTREKLNIYSPLPPSAQARFAPERPGVIQTGLTTARESIRPVVQAVTGAYVAVRTRSVNVYYAGEDVYYYLKDPPPEFLPRFGTVTMAGVLGMFLTRRGSLLKKLAVPLGLMTAGASVCYPAPTVALLKVTGKKAYAAGRWSSAAVSSLLGSKEPDIKGIAASPPQTASEASEPRTEVETAEPDESVVVREEAESKIHPDQTPTEANAETEAIATAEEISASVGSEEPSDTRHAAEEVSPAEPTPSLGPEAFKASPVEVVPVEVVPVEVVPVEVVPVEVVPVEVAPVEVAPIEAVSVEVAPVEVEEVAPVEVTPVEVMEVIPVEVVLVEVAPVEVAPVEVVPVEVEEVAPVEVMEVIPVEVVLVEVAPVEVVPVEVVEVAPVEVMEVIPVEVVLVEVAPVEVVPVEVVEVAPVEEPPASNEPTGPDVEPAVQPESIDPPHAAAPEETPTPPPAAGKGGSGFKQDSSLMDFGQSNPEDEDLYSTHG